MQNIVNKNFIHIYNIRNSRKQTRNQKMVTKKKQKLIQPNEKKDTNIKTIQTNRSLNITGILSDMRKEKRNYSKSQKMIRTRSKKSIQNKGKIKKQKKVAKKKIVSSKIPIQAKKYIDLLFATIFDTAQIQAHIRLYSQSIGLHSKSQLSINSISIGSQQKSSTQHNRPPQYLIIPQLYNLLSQYQIIHHRTLPQNIKYYIISALWDQGLIKVGTIQQWKQIILCHYHNNKHILSKQIQCTTNNLSQRLPTKQMCLVIELIEEHFHRQRLTLQKFIHTFESLQSHKQVHSSTPSNRQVQKQQIYVQDMLQKEQKLYKDIEDVLFVIFDEMDIGKIGSLDIQQIRNAYKLKDTNEKKEISTFVRNKFGNNVHQYDTATNTIKTLNSNMKKTKNKRVFIENILQIFNRIYPFTSMTTMSMHSCTTYNCIYILLQKYKELREAIQMQEELKTKTEQREGDKRRELLEQMKDIKRQAAYRVHQTSQDRDMRISIQDISDRHQHLSLLQTAQQYRTRKNEQLPSFNSNQINTHRQSLQKRDNTRKYQQNSTEKKKRNPNILDHSMDSKQNKDKLLDKMGETLINGLESSIRNSNYRNSFNNEDKNYRSNGGYIQESAKNNVTVIKSKQLLNDAGNYNSTHPNIYQSYHNNTEDKSKIHINPFETTPEPQPSFGPFKNINLMEDRYDKLLRERIEIELDIIKFEKIRNKIKYYDLIYQEQQ